jgi:hypothetical protein
VKRLLRLWFGFSERIDRRTYFLTGVGLMFFKHGVDTTVVWLSTGRWWSPLDYVSPVWSVRSGALCGVSPEATL